MGHPNITQGQPRLTLATHFTLADHLDIGELTGGGEVTRVTRFDKGDRVGQVEVEHAIGVSLVDVDGSGMSSAVRRSGIDRAEQPAGPGLHQPNRGAPGRAQIGEVARP